MSCRDIQPQLECWFLVELHPMHCRVLLSTGRAGWCNRLLLWGILLSKWHHCWASVSLSTWNIWRQSWPYSARWMFNLPTGENLWLGHWYKQQQYLDRLPSRSLLSSRWVVGKWWVAGRKTPIDPLRNCYFTLPICCAFACESKGEFIIRSSVKWGPAYCMSPFMRMSRWNFFDTCSLHLTSLTSTTSTRIKQNYNNFLWRNLKHLIYYFIISTF